MQVILTPTAVADKFGPGLNGFNSSIIPPATQLSAEWFDSVQQEIVNVILGQGIALDGLAFDQLKTAFDNYVFLNPEISGTMKILGGASLVVKSGGTLQCDPGSTAIFDAIDCTSVTTTGDVEVGGNLDLTNGSISNVTTIGSTGLASLGSVATAVATVTDLVCGIASFAGTVNASNSVVRMLEADFSATTLTIDAGEMRWDGTKIALGDGFKANPLVIYVGEVFTETPGGGGGALAGSVVNGSSVTVSLTIGDVVWVEGGFETTNSLNLSPSAGLEVFVGGGTTVLHATTRKIAVANDFADVNIRYRYTALATASHVFRMTHGAATGNTTTRNVGVTVRHTI